MPDKPVMFGPKAAQRIKDAVIRVERMPYPTDRQVSAYPRISGSGPQVIEGIITSTITAANTNTNTYGQGMVQPYVPTLNTNTNSYQWTIDPSFNSSGASTCINWYANNGNAINTNTHVVMFQRNTANGAFIFEVLGADC
jgi:hypothetical protein